ncbi:MAG: hypothetical protein HONDAALG_01711 [Gammaproteobacteria bacterium]|nr:hypothetical protein [Gammaproteobacteria bacterium]
MGLVRRRRAIFAAVIESLITDRRAAERAGEAGRAMVETYYNWMNLARRLEDFLVSGAAPEMELAVTQQARLETLESGLEATR